MLEKAFKYKEKSMGSVINYSHYLFKKEGTIWKIMI